MATMRVKGCGNCPFSARDFYGNPACKATLYLDPSADEWVRSFEVRGKVGGHWMEVYPAPPPDWCPIRMSGSITLELASGD